MAPRGSRDNPDPNLIIKGSRQRIPASDPLNGEPAVAALDALVNQIIVLSRSLPSTIPIATKDDKIYHVITNVQGEDPTVQSIFNRRMDILFAESPACRNSDGRLIHVRRGKLGMDLLIKYLRKIEWAEIPPDLASIKLTRLVTELAALCDTASAPASSDLPAAAAKNLRSTPDGTVTVEDGDEDDDYEEAPSADVNPPRKRKSRSDADGDDSSDDGSKHVPGPGGKRSHITKKGDRQRQKRRKSSPSISSDPTAVDADGMLLDVQVQAIASEPVVFEPTADVVHFAGVPYLKPGPKGDTLHRKCSLCTTVTVSDVSTVRRHLQKFHKAAYHKWAKKNNFESKLSDDVKARAEAEKAAADATAKLHQQTIEGHLKEKPARPPAYTDQLWLDAAVEWLAATDQPIDALTHPKFKAMIDIAARATQGVNIPNRRQTRAEIIKLFHDQMDKLKIRLHSDAVTGLIHVTCDAWQADNTDGYYVVTGHWMEETSPGVWVLREALFGFVQLNNAHHGVRLGQALYKIIARLDLVKRVGYITCDNASNNGTMLEEFALQILRATGQTWDPVERRINCLAHVINLATQKLISTYSQASHFTAHDPNAHIPDTSRSPGHLRDEIGLLRAIAVKERSSAKRKELFRGIQLRGTPDPAVTARQMVLDMKVRWSSTYAMLDRGHELKMVVDKFVFEMAHDEKNWEKREKLAALQLTEEEWTRVDLFLNVLQSAQDAQHAFSADLRSTLHLAIPALEKLHAEWTAKSTQPKYSVFHTALAEALDKVNEYYEKTSNTNSYMFAMVLDPRKKLSYFEKHWPPTLQAEAKKNMEETFKERYQKLHELQPRPSVTKTTQSSNAAPNKRRRAVTPLAEDFEVSDLSVAHIDPARPWLDEYQEYLTAREGVSEGVSTIEWWGWNYHRYPVWGSLARDYLAIMASSVSSERAFSSAGITISKRRNRLKPDIVEALQFLKCVIRRDLLFRVPVVVEDETDDEEVEMEIDALESWDILLDDDPDNYELPCTLTSTVVPDVDMES